VRIFFPLNIYEKHVPARISGSSIR